MRRVVLIVSFAAALCAACSSHASTATTARAPSSAAPTSGMPAKPTPFPATPGVSLPAGTVRIPVAGKFGLQGPLDLVTDGHYVWTEGLNRIDPTSNKATPLADGYEADFVAASAGTVWASDFNNNAVRRFTSSGRLVATIPGISGAEGLALVPGALWVAAHEAGTIDRIDVATDKITDRVPAASAGPGGVQWLAAAEGRVWGGATNTQTVTSVGEASRRKSVTVSLASVGGDPCGAVAITPAAGWVSSCFDETQLAEFSPRTGRLLRAQDIGAKVIGIVADGDDVWFVAGSDPDPNRGPNVAAALVELDPHWKVLHKYLLGPDFTSGGIVKAFGAIWVGNSSAPEVLRIPVG